MKRVSILISAAVLLLATVATPASAFSYRWLESLPLFAQEKGNWCWAASAQMVMQWNGTYKAQCDIVKYIYKLDCYDNTATIENVKSVLSGMGGLSSTTANMPLRFEEIQTAIGASQPFILRWSWSSGGGHFVVGTGWEVSDTGVQSVYLNDPGPVGYGEVRKETYAYVRGGSGYGQTWTHSLYNVKKP